MKQSSVRRALILSMVAGVLLSACSGTATPAPATQAPATQAPATQAPATQGASQAPSTAPASAAPGTAEKVIYFGSGAAPGSPEDYLIPLFTTARDILKSEGYDLQYTALATDPVVEAALDRGRIDVALLSMVGLQQAVKAGLHMKWAVTNETQNTFVLVVPSSVTDLTQLKGKKIGTQDATSLSTAAIPGILGPAGLAPTDYTLVNMPGSAARVAAMVAGTMDASMLLYTLAESKLVNSTDPAIKGKWKIWGGGAAPGPALMWEGLVMSDAFRANTVAATAFVKALLKAYADFYTQDPTVTAYNTADPAAVCKDAVARGYNELAGLDEAGCTADLKLYQSEKLFPADGGLAQTMYDGMITTLVAANQMTQADAVSFTDAVDPSFVSAP